VTSSSDYAVAALVQDFNKNFAIKDLGDLHFFLGIEVKKMSHGLLLTQEKYATDLLDKVGMRSCKSAPTPLSSSEQLLSQMVHLLALRIALNSEALLELYNI
jgi:histone deacetylase 1/2